MIFSIAGDDDDALEVPFSAADWKETPLLDEIRDGPPAVPSGEAALSLEEQKEYDEIEAQFQKFKSRQSEVERNVAVLLERLNTRINVPSSVASSECGDLTSLASSEWDTESLGPTEDGLSMLGSRVGSHSGTPRGGSPTNSPRELTPLQRAASSSSVGLKSQLQQAGIEWRAPPKVTRSSPFASSPGPGSSGAAASSQAPAAFQPPERRAADGGLILGPRGSEGGSERGGAAAAGSVDASGLCPGGGDQLQPGGQAERPSGELPSELRTPRLTQRLLQERACALPPQSPEWPGQGPSLGAAPSSAPSALGAASSSVAGVDAASFSPKWARAQPPSPQGPRLPQFGAPGVCDGSEADQADEEEEIRRWQGWTVVATPEGRLFFHHEMRLISQWHQPPELNDILGEWVEVTDESQPSRPTFWRNELLNISLWKDPRQTTNLFQAALDGNIFFMQLYAEVDGQLDVVDSRARSALHYSCAGGSTQSAVFLLQRGAEVDRRDDAAATPLIFACRYGYASVVKVLLDASADLNSVCEGGNTALHEAASMGQLDCVHLLLLCGADPTALNDSREAAVDIAASKRHYSVLTLLHRHDGSSQRQRPLPEGPPLGMPGYGVVASSGLEVPRAAASSASPAPPHAGAAEAKAVPPTGPRSAPRQSGAGVRHRKYSQTSRSRYRGGHSDSDLDGRAARASPLDQDGTDSGGATSESSDGGARGSAGRQHRGRSRRRERSPVALGLLNRMQWIPQWLGSASRWAFKSPVQADLGLPNKYYYNEETKRWEMPGEEDHRPR